MVMSPATDNASIEDVPPLVRVTVDVPTDLAAHLRSRMPNLDLSESLVLMAHLYRDAPIEREGYILTGEEFGRICVALGFTPQSSAALVGGIEEFGRVSIAGVKVQATLADLDILQGRNASGLAPREWAAQIFAEMFRAWIDGRF